MKKVLVITYYWPPSGGAGVQRWLKLTKYLPQFGWEPVVLTVRPEDATYPVTDHTLEADISGETRVIKTRSREVYSVYQRLYKPDQIPNAGFASGDADSFMQKLARFIRGNFFIPDPRKGWNKAAFQAAKRLIREENIDCIITSSPPHSTQLIGHKLSRRFSIPWVADLRDPWTGIYYYRQLYPTFLAHQVNLRLERKVLKDADQIITVGPSLKEHFQHKGRVKREKIQVVTNGFDEADFSDLPGPGRKEFLCTYVGTLSDQYPIDAVVSAIKELTGPAPPIKFRLVGSVSEKQRKKLESLPANTFEFIPQVDHHAAIRYMAESHLLLLITPEHSSGKSILTGKLFEYLATGNHILGIGPVDGDASAVLKETKSGIMLDPGDNHGIKKAIQSALEKYKTGQPTRRPGNDHMKYSRENLTRTYAEVLNRITEQ